MTDAKRGACTGSPIKEAYAALPLLLLAPRTIDCHHNAAVFCVLLVRFLHISRYILFVVWDLCSSFRTFSVVFLACWLRLPVTSQRYVDSSPSSWPEHSPNLNLSPIVCSIRISSFVIISYHHRDISAKKRTITRRWKCVGRAERSHRSNSDAVGRRRCAGPYTTTWTLRRVYSLPRSQTENSLAREPFGGGLARACAGENSMFATT